MKGAGGAMSRSKRLFMPGRELGELLFEKWLLPLKLKSESGSKSVMRDFIMPPKFGAEMCGKFRRF